MTDEDEPILTERGDEGTDAAREIAAESGEEEIVHAELDRQTGQTISALDAIWNPEYGSREELEACIGGIISHLDGALSQLAQMPMVHPHLPFSYGVIRSVSQYFKSLQTALRMRGLGVFPINQLAFDERDMRITKGTEHWFDALAQSPNALINSYRVRLASKLSVGILREDQTLPEGWKYEPRVRPYRRPDRNPFFESVEPGEHHMGATKFPDCIDLIGDFSEPHGRNLANSIRAFQLKAVKGDFSARREEVRRDFEAPAQRTAWWQPVWPLRLSSSESILLLILVRFRRSLSE